MKMLKSWTAALLLGSSLAFAASTPAVAAEDNWPNQQITFVIALGSGGSADRTARLVAQRMQDKLGVPIRAINQEGGGGHVGHVYFQNMPKDGTFFLVTSIHPYISSAILNLNASYTLDDFAFVNGQWTDIDLFALNAKLPYDSLDEFMQAVTEAPGKFRISVVPGSTGHINTVLMLEAYGLTTDAVNIVTYESGNAARTAAAGGQVDMTVLGADGTISIKEFIKPLAVASEQRLADWDAPTLNEVLEKRGVEPVTPLVGSMRGIAAHAEFKEKYPQRFEKFSNTYKEVLSDPAFQKMLNDQGIGSDWLGPEKTTEIIHENFKILERFKDQL
ncbi:tripartite tricarboxylate transporter substrate-binding protein [Paenalcaligenes niemegkensis]|uniref:Bug family tripartite tricarboxylate transporter substrate binding protein n=1 Tax=Paenalcaligenes niemegkensis TaxID=2895469 RepID=UPI001EE97CC9|nr:tripartite tricarboxylate transporter substrate-binding protein [Paenalcaligenes niemegkensis]MCQ9615752.1 tripartite tricarboxylate transporter substrate-binding protein [Paenalcaligenes niemegkensis]